MRGQRWMVLMVAAMVAGFAGTGQAAVIYAKSVVASSGVNNSGNLREVQDLNYATFSNRDSATLGFEQNFVDVAGGDAMIYIEGYNKRNRIDVDAVRVDTGNGGVFPAPEPGTLMLLGSGLVGVAWWGRKKFRK